MLLEEEKRKGTDNHNNINNDFLYMYHYFLNKTLYAHSLVIIKVTCIIFFFPVRSVSYRVQELHELLHTDVLLPGFDVTVAREGKKERKKERKRITGMQADMMAKICTVIHVHVHVLQVYSNLYSTCMCTMLPFSSFALLSSFKLPQ